MTVYKAGFTWQADDNNTWRLGYSYGEQPIPSTEVLFNILAPGVMEHHLTFGWTNVRPSGSVLSWSLMYAPPKTSPLHRADAPGWRRVFGSTAWIGPAYPPG